MNIDGLYALFQTATGVCTDSRNIPPGSLFFALRGENFDGNRFATEALDKGAVAAVADNPALQATDRLIVVEDALATLQALARFHRRRLTATRFIALTGSNGKTTTKELMHAVLSQKFVTQATAGNLNNHIGVPLTLLNVKQACQAAIVEMGANHVGEIAQLCAIAEPDYGLITNIGKAHLEGFGGLEGVKKGKGELYDWLRKHGHTVFVHHDDRILLNMLNGYDNTVSYGSDPSCLVWGQAAIEGNRVTLDWRRAAEPDTSYRTRTRLTGLYNAPNLLAAVCVGTHFGVEPAAIVNALERYEPSNSRSQLAYKNGMALVLDHYNANPGSMAAAIDNFRDSDPGPGYPRRMLILGDMLELGSEAPPEHQAVADQALATGGECVFVGKLFGACRLPAGTPCFENSAGAAEWIKSRDLKGCYVLIKGSRGMRMEKIAAVLGGG